MFIGSSQETSLGNTWIVSVRVCPLKYRLYEGEERMFLPPHDSTQNMKVTYAKRGKKEAGFIQKSSGQCRNEAYLVSFILLASSSWHQTEIQVKMLLRSPVEEWL